LVVPGEPGNKALCCRINDGGDALAATDDAESEIFATPLLPPCAPTLPTLDDGELLLLLLRTASED
jgi:hypothetical protein